MFLSVYYRGTEQKGMQIRVLQRRRGYLLLLSLIVGWDWEEFTVICGV